MPQALTVLSLGAGKQFDAEFVQTFLRIAPQLRVGQRSKIPS